MNRRLPFYVQLLSQVTMILVATICIQLDARAEKTIAAQVWVTVISVPINASAPWKAIRTDGPDQWKQGAPWKTVAGHSQVAKLIAGNIENTRDADLQSAIEDIKSRHLELALEIGPLVRSADCKPKTESYGNPGETEAILQKIRRNGGDLRYIAMDEPLFYGHRDSGGCHLNTSLPALEQTLSAKPSPLLSLGPHIAEFSAIFAGDTPAPQAAQEWEQVSRHIQMVRLPAGVLQKMSDAALARMVLDLSARHIALGLEILATNWFHEPPCGGGIEGFIDPGSANQVVAKLLKAGGTVNLIAMDEPLWFGHFYSGKNACRSSIPDLASRVAVIVKIYTAAFPNVMAGDIEPFPAVSSQPNWQATYGSWVKAFQAATGSPLKFLHLDFDWWNPLLSSGPSHKTADSEAIVNLARVAASVARENDLMVGMIMNGGGPPADHSDADWIKQAHMHIRTLRDSGVHFDHVLVETWDKYPSHTFPETDQNALSSLIAFCARP